MSGYIPEFCKEADNVYRTPTYIIKQKMALARSEEGDAVMVSFDTFYVRTQLRDIEFMMCFYGRDDFEGTRLPCQRHTRTYVD